MKKVFTALILFSLLGLAASLYMTERHYETGARGFEEKSFCNVTEFVDCDAVLASRFSVIRTEFGTFLTSELGVIYYLLVFAGLLYAVLSGERGRGTLAFFFLSSLLAVLYSFLMAYLSIAKLGVLCLLCLTTYLSNLALAVLFPRALQIRYREIPHFLIRYFKALFGGVADLKPRLLLHLGMTSAVLVVGLFFFRGVSPEIHKAHAEVPREMYLKAYYAQPQKEISVEGRPSWGNDRGKVVVVEFSDFQCPFCKRAAFSLKPYMKEFRDDVRFVYVNYPLDSACNPAMSQGMHPVSCVAAKAALCAFQKGRFWEYHDKVFENQKRLSRETLLRLAGETGLDRSAFERCLVSDEIGVRLSRDVEDGNRLEVHGTPAIFINGRLFHDWLNPERLRMVIESEKGKI